MGRAEISCLGDLKVDRLQNDAGDALGSMPMLQDSSIYLSIPEPTRVVIGLSDMRTPLSCHCNCAIFNHTAALLVSLVPTEGS